jgi:hypothetical protein
LLIEAEILGAVHDKRIDLSKRTFVHQQINPLAGGKTAALVLSLNSFLAPT